MKPIFLAAAAMCLALAGCSDFTSASAGNPDATAYAGSPGSAYDTAANPPQAVGTVTYDPKPVPSAQIVVPTASAMPQAAPPPPRY